MVSSNLVDWQKVTFEDAFTDITAKATKVDQSEFLHSGKYPIVDQGQNFIAGYTDDEELVWGDDLPVVIFGDHTRILKYVDFPFVLGADGTKVLKPKKDILPLFAYYQLLSFDIPSAGYSRHFKFLKDYKFQYPSMDEQKRIASLLARADRLRQLRRTAHDLSASVLQSVFLEMFGDPVRNEKRWEERNLNDLCRNITDGTHDTPDRTDSGVPFITSKNIRPYEIDLSVLEYVSEETHKEILKRTNPQYGDVIYTNIGANLGNAAMNKLPFSFSLKNVALLQPNSEVLNSYYLEALLNNERFKDNLIYLSSAGGAQKFITLEVLRSISIPYPPISVQEQFATILESYQRMRTQQVESERQIETLFQDLLSQAFESHV
jgi:type I restriction enzyme S subunit